MLVTLSKNIMLKNIKASFMFWSVLSFMLTFLVFLTSRVYMINYVVSFKILFAVILAYNVLGLILSILSFMLNWIVNLFSPGNKKDIRWWLFGAVHGGIAVYSSSFYYLNKELQPNIFSLFFGFGCQCWIHSRGYGVWRTRLAVFSKTPRKIVEMVHSRTVYHLRRCQYNYDHDSKILQLQVSH